MTGTRFSEVLIVQYLLGELPENEQIQIEDRAFQDPAVTEEILAVEQDLIDEYVREGLTSDQRRRFESHFLGSAERRNKVKFARTLDIVLSDSIKDKSASIREAAPNVSKGTGFWSFLTRPAFAYSFAAAALLLVLFGGWMLVQSLRLRSELTRLQAANESQNAQQKRLEDDLAGERARNEQLQGELNQLPTPNSNSNEPTPAKSPVSIALTLLPGVSRSSGSTPQVTVGKDVNTVRVHIGIDPADDFQSYRLELNNSQGQTVLTVNKLKARSLSSGRTAVVLVPATILKSENYEVALQGINNNGSAEPLGFYYFRVIKK